jgi:FMN-dependent NADH-azoreductase
MSKVLVLNSSALGGASVSNQLAQDALVELRARDPGLIVTVRDLGANPIPHLNSDSATALRGAAPANEAQATAQELSDTLIAELKAADAIVIGAPMYNFGIPSTLKAWFDYVLRAGVTFRYTEAGPVGLLEGKRAIIIESRGGYYRESRRVLQRGRNQSARFARAAPQDAFGLRRNQGRDFHPRRETRLRSRSSPTSS